MTTVKGPGIFLAQFLGDKAPFNNLQSICLWAEALGFKGVQIPSWDSRCIDLQKAAENYREIGQPESSAVRIEILRNLGAAKADAADDDGAIIEQDAR